MLQNSGLLYTRSQQPVLNISIKSRGLSPNIPLCDGGEEWLSGCALQYLSSNA